MLSLLLGRVLLRRAQGLGHRGTLRNLIHRLGEIRLATVAEQPAGRGRPRVCQVLEDCDPELRRLGKAPGALE